MACNGNSSETCGGANRLNLYTFVPSIQSATTTSNAGMATSQTTSGSSSTSSRTPTAAGPVLPSGWHYSGCYIDGANGGRILAHQELDNSNLTIESCVSTCVGLGYSIAGMEYSVQCFCDVSLIQVLIDSWLS